MTAPELTLAAAPVAASTGGPRLTTLEPRHHGATDISLESALDNTGQIVANLLANRLNAFTCNIYYSNKYLFHS